MSGVEQVREARRMVADAAAELTRRGETVPRVPVGVMIEIPAAAYTADLLAREVDFFTIGTNDLIQYCLAVDRADERVSRLYEPLHPAILRMIVMVRRAAARQRIPVSLCGEMASDPALLVLDELTSLFVSVESTTAPDPTLVVEDYVLSRSTP